MLKKIISALIISLIVPFVAQAQSETFTDVYSTHINKDAVEYLKTNDVVEGYEDGSYKPENRINRAEFIKIIVAAQVDEPWGSYCFTDVKDEWFAKYICTAKRLGYISGYEDGSFKPSNFINFAEASKIITKALKVSEDKSGTNGEWFAGYVNGLAKKKAIPSTVNFFDKEITRGDMAEIIWRLKANKTDKVSMTYTEITSPFPAIQSCTALKEKFDEYQSYQYRPDYYMRGDVMIMDEEMALDSAEGVAAPVANAMTKSAESTAGAGAASDEYSTTNIQVAGVDEADIIKNDGQYIYMIKGDTVRIINAHPASTLAQTAKITFGDKSFNPQEMFVDGDKLVVIGQTYDYNFYPNMAKRMAIMPRYRSTQTKVYIYDISDRANPEQDRTVRFDGYYTTSRRINDQVYLILNAAPDVWNMSEVTRGEELLPSVQDNEDTPEPMVACGDIRYFPGFGVPRYMVVASLPINDKEGKIEREVFLGSSENVYSSQDNLYVASSRVNYDRYTDWDWQTDHTSTQVFRFALDNGKIEFKARGEVPGNILNQFSMDDHASHFRIATTKGNTWNDTNPSTNNVYVLNRDMETVGQLEDLAPGEKIYSTRFLGNRLYMVTYKQVDPLFVIDLTRPTTPTLLGKLKIPGFSNYLHPYDENHIIGFGKDTEETKTGALMQGMKIALFDVSDVKNPVQQFTEVIGDRGTDSELLRNHKALLFDKDKELLAFPVTIQKKITPEEMDCGLYTYSDCPTSYCQRRCIPSSCSKNEQGYAECTTDCDGLGSCINSTYDRYETEFMGALVYNLNLKDGFTLKGRITHLTDDEILKMGSYWYSADKMIQRIIYIGDYLYTISPGMIKGSTLQTLKEIKSLVIDGTSDSNYMPLDE